MKRVTLILSSVLLLSTHVFGAVVYSNITPDLGLTSPMAANGYTQIGDQIQLGGTERLATLATVEFYNNGAAGNFDATLRFFAVGPSVANPVGAQIGGDFTQTIAAPLGGGLTGFLVSFALPSLLVPTDLIFTISIANEGAGVQIVGLDYYGPTASVGSSDASFIIARDAGGYLQSATQDLNLYFELQADAATNIPEPATSALAGAAIAGLFLLRRARRA